MKKRSISFFIFASALCAQNTAVFPGRVATSSDLYVASNNFSTTLLIGITSTSTSATVASTSGFTAPGAVTIDGEITAVCQVSGGNTLTFGKSSCPNVDGRGIDGSTAAAHLANATAQGRVVATLHNQTAAEITAIEQRALQATYVTDSGALCDGATDDTTAFLDAIAAVAPGGVIYLPAGKECKVGALGTQAKVFVLEGNGATILPATDGIWLATSFVGDTAPFIFRDVTFSQASGFTPTDIFKLDGQPNTRFENVNFYLAVVSHALIWNCAAYGTHIQGGNWHYNTASGGALLYASYAAAGDFSQFTLALSTDSVDWSNNTGLCVGIEGGSLSFSHSVIESCAGGGLQHFEDFWYATVAADDVHFESNKLFNFKLPSTGTNPNAVISTVMSVHGSSFANNPSSVVGLLGQQTQLSFTYNTVDSACLDSAYNPMAGAIYLRGNNFFGAPTNCVASLYYALSNTIAPIADAWGSLTNSGAYVFSFSQSTTPMTTGLLANGTGAPAQIWVDNTSPYTAGTVSVTNGSSAVTGSGTTWTQFLLGGVITIGSYTGTVVHFSSASSIQISPPFAGSTASGVSYSIDSHIRAQVLNNGTLTSNLDVTAARNVQTNLNFYAYDPTVDRGLDCREEFLVVEDSYNCYYYDGSGFTLASVVPPPGGMPLSQINLISASNGMLIYCSDCKNVADDAVTFDSAATGSGHGSHVLRENGAWRVH